MEQQTMGEMIADLRRARGMTQAALAQQMHVTDKAVSKWERNLSCPDVKTIPQLAQILGVSVEELMTASAPAEQPENARRQGRLDLILGAVPLAMGVAVTVLALLGEAQPGELMPLVGIGLSCVGLRLLGESRT